MRCGAVPAEPGIYVLELELAEEVRVKLGRSDASLGPGRYLYVGSAGGPGGLRGRLCRHARSRGGAGRWHVDRLLAAGRVVGAYALVGPSGREWEVAAAEALASRLRPALEGFGNTDTGGPTHLFEAGPAEEVEGALRSMSDGWAWIPLGDQPPRARASR